MTQQTAMNAHIEGNFDNFYHQYAEQIKATQGVALGEVSIFCGDDVQTNTRGAYTKALSMLQSGFFRRVMVLNTSSNQRWALSLGRKIAPGGYIGNESRSAVWVYPSTLGKLSKQFQSIQDTVRKGNFDVVMINSWELASKSPRLKEELMFQLRELCLENVTVIVYTQAPVREYKAGMLLRGSLGKLSVIAQVLAPIEDASEADSTAIEAYQMQTQLQPEVLALPTEISSEPIDRYEPEIANVLERVAETELTGQERDRYSENQRRNPTITYVKENDRSGVIYSESEETKKLKRSPEYFAELDRIFSPDYDESNWEKDQIMMHERFGTPILA